MLGCVWSAELQLGVQDMACACMHGWMDRVSGGCCGLRCARCALPAHAQRAQACSTPIQLTMHVQQHPGVGRVCGIHSLGHSNDHRHAANAAVGDALQVLSNSCLVQGCAALLIAASSLLQGCSRCCIVRRGQSSCKSTKETCRAVGEELPGWGADGVGLEAEGALRVLDCPGRGAVGGGSLLQLPPALLGGERRGLKGCRACCACGSEQQEQAEQRSSSWCWSHGEQK
jgi:hypothetical protein